jgi:protein subunit release factor A
MKATPGHRPPPYSLDRASLEREVRVDVFRASGAGGQHLHRTESAVRLTHGPSGVMVVASDTRSQNQNRELAFARLVERLKRLNVRPKKRKPTKPTAAARVRRLEGKRRRAVTKKSRGRWGLDD